VVSSGRFRVSKIERVLKKCLGSFEKKVADHKVCYTANGLRFPSFPKGEHGPKTQKSRETWYPWFAV